MKIILVKLITLYQYVVSPFFGPSCRFTPTCSNYAIEAINVHGIFKGSWLAIRRLGRCHPWHEGGLDLVPGVNSEAAHAHKGGCNHG